mgnify:CR=1 FL=1
MDYYCFSLYLCSTYRKAHEVSTRFQRGKVYLSAVTIIGDDGSKSVNGRLIYSLGYFTRATHHYFDRPHGCDQYLFIYCKEGCGHIRIEDREYVLHPYQFIILPPNVRHQYEADDTDPWSIYWLHFKGKKASLYATGFDKPTCLNLSLDSKIEERLNLFEEMYATLKNGFETANINYANVCLNFFLSSLLYLNQFNRSQAGTSKSEYKGCIINWAIYYMHENINKSLTLKDISSYVNYSTSYFYRKFIKETGIAPLSYFTLMKIEKACSLLTTTDMQINQIASLLGYSDPLYFSRVFTKIKSISPGKFRTRHKKNP